MPVAARQHAKPPSDPAADQAARLRCIVGPVSAPARPPSRPERTRADEPAGSRAVVVSVSSGKGGVGKTNVCVNLSIALTDLRRRTTLVDADLGMANADVLCGLSPSRRLDSILAAEGGAGMRQIAVEAPGGFRLVPGAVGIERMANLSAEDRAALVAALEELEGHADLIIVDTAAGLGQGVTTMMRAADASLVVATPEPASITDAYALVKCVVRGTGTGSWDAEAVPSPILVVNQVSGEREARAVHARLAAVCERFLGYRLPLLGWVVQDARVGAAVRARVPVLLHSPSCPASRDFRALALSLVRALRPVGAPEPARTHRAGLRRVLSALMLRGG